MTGRDRAETVAIIGAGIGGLYLAAELGVAGFKLRLHDIDDARLSDIRTFGGIDVEGGDGEPGRDQMAAHRAAHVPQPDEGDARHRTPTSSPARA